MHASSSKIFLPFPYVASSRVSRQGGMRYRFERGHCSNKKDDTEKAHLCYTNILYCAILLHLVKCLMSCIGTAGHVDRKSTRLNSSHPSISYAVFCLKKKNKI